MPEMLAFSLLTHNVCPLSEYGLMFSDSSRGHHSISQCRAVVGITASASAGLMLVHRL